MPASAIFLREIAIFFIYLVLAQPDAELKSRAKNLDGFNKDSLGTKKFGHAERMLVSQVASLVGSVPFFRLLFV